MQRANFTAVSLNGKYQTIAQIDSIKVFAANVYNFFVFWRLLCAKYTRKYYVIISILCGTNSSW